MVKSLINSNKRCYCFNYKTFYITLIIFGFFSIYKGSAQHTKFEDLQNKKYTNIKEIKVFMKVNLNGKKHDVLFYNAIFDTDKKIVEEKKLDLFYLYKMIYDEESKSYKLLDYPVYDQTSYIYKKGKLDQSKTINDESYDGTSYKYEYNDLGQLSARYFYNDPFYKRLFVKSIYFYKDNKLSKTHFVHDDKRDTDESWVEYNKAGKELKHWENGKIRMENYYEKDSILLKRVYDLNRGTKYKPKEITYSYDNNNNMVERSVYNYDTKELESKKLYEYDSFGNLIEEKKVFGDPSDSKYSSNHKKYEYDINKNLVVEEWFANNKKIKYYFYAKYKFFK